MVADVASNKTVSGYVPLYNHGPNQTVSTAPVCVEFKVAKTSDFAHVESSGRAYTSSDIDYTVKVEASNLTAWTRYYYQFNICDSDKKSPLGRTKTTPDENDYVSKVGLAVYSCSNFPFGFFNAYGNPARKDSVDFVLHLGDYIYEVSPRSRTNLTCLRNGTDLLDCSMLVMAIMGMDTALAVFQLLRRSYTPLTTTDSDMLPTALTWTFCYRIRPTHGFRSGTITRSLTTPTAMALPS